MNGTRQLLVSADDDNLSGGHVRRLTIKKKHARFLSANMDTGLDVNPDRTKDINVLRGRN
jgi:hypothetical protein